MCLKMVIYKNTVISDILVKIINTKSYKISSDMYW
jgi:hypothetical protein